jgi:hypothetical protein
MLLLLSLLGGSVLKLFMRPLCLIEKSLKLVSTPN